MDVVLVLREAAQIFVKVALVGVVQAVEVVVPASVLGREAVEEVLAQVAEVVGRAVALGVFVLELVAELQERRLEYRLAVGGSDAVVPVFLRREIVAVGLVGGVLPCLVERFVQVHVVGAQAVALAVAVVAAQAQCHVASLAVEPAVEHEHSANALGLAVGYAALPARVDGQPLGVHQCQGVVGERVAHVEIRIITERGGLVEAHAVALRQTERRAEHDGGHRVGMPLQASLGVPGVAA